MSQQLTLSSLFSVLALAMLCVVTTARDIAGRDLTITAPVKISQQAESLPALLAYSISE